MEKKNNGFDIDIRITTYMAKERPPYLGATGGESCTDRCDNASTKAAGCNQMVVEEH